MSSIFVGASQGRIVAKIRARNHFTVSLDSSGWKAVHKESALSFIAESWQGAYKQAIDWLADNYGGLVYVKDEYGNRNFSKMIAPKVEPKNLFN